MNLFSKNSPHFLTNTKSILMEYMVYNFNKNSKFSIILSQYDGDDDQSTTVTIVHGKKNIGIYLKFTLTFDGI
jgi:hypothetical protein